jgi:hypothetical protein
VASVAAAILVAACDPQTWLFATDGGPDATILTVESGTASVDAEPDVADSPGDDGDEGDDVTGDRTAGDGGGGRMMDNACQPNQPCECMNDMDCTQRNWDPYCDTSRHECVECIRGVRDCPDPVGQICVSTHCAARCDPNQDGGDGACAAVCGPVLEGDGGYYCLQCDSKLHCSSPKPICVFGGLCAQCATTQDCKGLGSMPLVCSQSNSCVRAPSDPGMGGPPPDQQDDGGHFSMPGSGDR